VTVDNVRTSQDGAAAIAAMETRIRALEAAATRRYQSAIQGSYTPSLTNLAIGTGGVAVNSAVYSFDGVHLFVSGRAMLGTSGQSVGTSPRFGLPSGFTPATDLASWSPLGPCSLLDTDLGQIGEGQVQRGTVAGTVTVLQSVYTAPYNRFVNISATSPFTWAAGDGFRYTFAIPGTFT
jgi:hypothetical protein